MFQINKSSTLFTVGRCHNLWIFPTDRDLPAVRTLVTSISDISYWALLCSWKHLYGNNLSTAPVMQFHSFYWLSARTETNQRHQIVWKNAPRWEFIVSVLCCVNRLRIIFLVEKMINLNSARWAKSYVFSVLKSITLTNSSPLIHSGKYNKLTICSERNLHARINTTNGKTISRVLRGKIENFDKFMASLISVH